MSLVNKSSLSITLDNLNQIFFDGKKLSSSEKKGAALFIASRQGLKGSYWGMFAPMPGELDGVTLFTGEKLTSRASISHILGEESLRALYLLGVEDPRVNAAVSWARSGLGKALERYYTLGYYTEGLYCCGKCSAAYWRNLSAEGVNKNKNVLNAGMKFLKTLRDGKGKWKRFPFWYSVLSLSGIGLKAAKEELEYASPVLKRIADGNIAGNAYEIRKRSLSQRVLSAL